MFINLGSILFNDKNTKPTLFLPLFTNSNLSSPSIVETVKQIFSPFFLKQIDPKFSAMHTAT